MTDPIFDPKRLISLERTALVGSPPEPYFDRITRLVRQVVGAEIALLSLVTDDKQFFKSSCGFSGPAADARQTPLSHSLCKYVVNTGDPFIVSDARKMDSLRDHGAVTDLGVVSYLGVPVHAPDGQVIGSLCAINTVAQDWSDVDLQAMQDLAGVIDDDLALRHRAMASDQLAYDNGILAHEYHHRVKNALAVSAALVKMSGRDATSVADLIEKAGNRLSALADAHSQLIQFDDSVDLRDLSDRLLRPYCSQGSSADLDGPSVRLAHTQITPVCFFIHELATNSAKYGAFKHEGVVGLRWAVRGETIEMDWTEALTDGMQRSPEGFGSRLVEMAARQLTGTVKTTWSEEGLNVSLDFPLIADAQTDSRPREIPGSG